MRRESEHGCLYWRQVRGRWALVIQGDVGTDPVRDILLSEEAEDNPGGYTQEVKQALVKGLDKRWGDMEKFFTQGGVINQRGVFIPFKPKTPKPGTNLATYSRDRLTVSALPGRQAEYLEHGFTLREALYLSAPHLYVRLQAIPTLRQGYNVELDQEPQRWEFLKGVRKGFGSRFAVRLPDFDLGYRIFPVETAVDQKLYELAMRARREVLLAQALRS